MKKRKILFNTFLFIDDIKLFITTKYNLIRYCYIFAKGSSKKVRIRNKVRFNPFREDKLRIVLKR